MTYILFLSKGIFFLISDILNEYIDTKLKMSMPLLIVHISAHVLDLDFFVIWVTEKGSSAPRGEEE